MSRPVSPLQPQAGPSQPTPPQPHVQPQPQPQPQSQPQATATATTSDPPPQTFRQKLNAGDAHWPWKVGLRAVLVVTGIIGIGCMAWALSSSRRNGPYEYEFDDYWAIPWSLITFAISVIWCAICILVLLLRRPNAPVHPGVRVGIDLILWLAFIPTAMFALLGVLSVMQWGSDGTIGRYSSYGYYYHADNGTWVWNATAYDSYYQTSRDCSSDGRYSRYDNYGFASCADEDAYVNDLWNSKTQRANAEMTGTVCQFIGLVLHLALFIWACVDTHYRNSRKVSKEAEQLAADIVMNMVRSGAIIPAPGTQMRQPMGPPMMPQQAYMQPHQQQHVMPQQYPMVPHQPVISGSEKGQGPRYA